MKGNHLWKITGIIALVVLYFVLLGYIASIQSDYKVCLETEQSEYHFTADAETPYSLEVVIQNRSNRKLGSADNIFLTYHVYDREGNTVCFENIRSALDANVFAHSKGKSVLLIMPLAQGEYQVDIDLVEEGVAWFSEKDGQKASIRLVAE